ncbi:MAG: alpha/beta hydrolase [Chloroflexi bacterium]|nr:alpha/beta hydrolase [Chloroflexota bacterium]
MTTTTTTIRRAYADTPYGQLHYRYAGQGQPLLLFHQTATCSECFDGATPFLAPSYRVIAVDTPGFGMSDKPPKQWTVADYTRCFVAFLDALRIERTSVYSHHTGATWACELAAAYPSRVDKLILDGTPYWPEPPSELMQRLQPIVLKDDGSHLMAVWEDITGRVKTAFPRPYSRKVLETINAEVLWKLMAGTRYHEGYVALYQYDILSRLPLIQAPTLVMAGAEDGLRRTIDPVAARIRRARTYVGKGGSYLKTYEDPEALAHVILEFLQNPGV